MSSSISTSLSLARRSPERRAALILGFGWVAQRIAGQLRTRGFETEIQASSGHRLPAPLEPSSLGELRRVLQDFASRQTECDLFVHPGISFWAERPEFAVVCHEMGIRPLCPPVRTLTVFSNKLHLIAEAEKQGIPNLVLSFDPMHTVREIEAFKKKTKQRFPFVLKTVKGTRDFGVYVVHESDDLERRLPQRLEQIRRSMGEVILFAERYLEGARFITVPFVRFQSGKFESFALSDGSLQCRFRKLVEFCPAEEIDSVIEKQIRDWAEALAEHTGFVGVGTLEFMIESNRAFLVDGLARVNASFHLWEQVEGTQAVHWQVAALLGEEPESVLRVPQKEWKSGVGLRLYAEDSMLQLPQPGIVAEVQEAREWNFPSARAEVDLAVAPGSRVSPADHGLIGLVWAGGADRKQALTVARGVLEELWIAGSLQTNERFLAELLAHPWVREGIFHAGFVDEEFIPTVRPSIELIRVFASVCTFVPQNSPQATDSATTPPAPKWAVGDQWVKPDPQLVRWIGQPRIWPKTATQTTESYGISGWLELLDGSRHRVCAFPTQVDRWQVRIGNWVLPIRKGNKAKGQPRVSALVSGKVHAIFFRQGATAPAHEALLIIESLGMLIPHALPVDVRISKWKVSAEQEVQAGDELAEFEVISTS